MSLRPLDGRMSGGLADGQVVVTMKQPMAKSPKPRTPVKEGELAPPPKTIPLGKLATPLSRSSSCP